VLAGVLEGAAAEFRVVRLRSTHGTLRPAGRLMRRNLREFVLIVTGVLVALFIDTLREGYQERRILDDYLQDVAAEIEQNDYTLRAMRDGLLPQKLAALDRVLEAFDDSTILVTDSAAFMHDLAASAWSVRPWLISDRYEALRSSGQLRLLRDTRIASSLAGFHEAPTILFALADELRSDYLVRVQTVLPPEMANELSPVRNYLPEGPPPKGGEQVEYREIWTELRRRRGELREGARSELAYATAYRYALLRYQAEFAGVLRVLAPWRPATGTDSVGGAG